MSAAATPLPGHPNDCGCCAGLTSETPTAVTNRPGLAAVSYRVGTHSTFKASMLAALSDDDFTIALLDGAATMADVLTFYQERLANESYLRTATERRSVLELARLIGYEPSTGVAASTHLAFTLEDAPGAAGQALSLGLSAGVVAVPPPPPLLAVRAKGRSIPGQDGAGD